MELEVQALKAAVGDKRSMAEVVVSETQLRGEVESLTAKLKQLQSQSAEAKIKELEQVCFRPSCASAAL